MKKIRKGDDVIVISGKDAGKSGAVLRVTADDRIYVENINMVKRHTKPNPAMGTPGGIVEKEASLHISNVAHLNPSTKKADRIGFRMLEDGKKVRYYKSSGEVVDV